MKRFEFAIPEIARGRLFAELLFCGCVVAMTVVFVIECESYWAMIIPLFFTASEILMFVVLLNTNNAFCLYKISECGVENKKLSISWDEITNYKIVAVRVLERNILKGYKEYTSLIAFGEDICDNYLTLDRTKCVFFPLTKENLEKIDSYCNKKNAVISDLLEKYYNVVE